MSTLAERLSHLIDVAELDFDEVDRLAGLKSSGHTGQIARGTKEHPRATTAVALAGVFGASVEWLVTGVGEAPSDRKIRRAVERAREGSHADKCTPRRRPGKVPARSAAP